MVGRNFLNSPGPKYSMPTAIGFDRHDPRLTRAPAFTIAPARKMSRKRTGGPGPKYDCAGKTPAGGDFPTKEAYLTAKPKFTYTRGPAPLNYGAHLCPDFYHERAPEWVLLSPAKQPVRATGPAPKYKLQDYVGGRAPELPTAPQYTILGRAAIKMPKTASPGPGKYRSTSPSAYKTRAPTPAVLSRHIVQKRSGVPGPKYRTDYVESNLPPAWSFGVKHSPIQKILYTAEDRKPFYSF